MKITFKKFLHLASFSFCLLLVACAVEPSPSEVNKAIEELFKNNSNFLQNQKILGVIAASAGMKDIKLNSVDKIGCEPNGKNAYLCEIAVEYTITSTEGSVLDLLGVGGRKRSINKYRLVKTAKGWIVDESSFQ